MSKSGPRLAPGPFRADQIREGDPYELSDGHPVECLPSGKQHAAANVAGSEVLDTDPEVEWAGVDAGWSPEPKTLRAADVSLGRPSEGPESGWAAEAPRLALEYAGVGQDEAELQAKIADFLAAGTEVVWVVRLVGPRRVEIYRPGQVPEVKGAGEELTAPGILRNPVPVLALFDRREAHRATLRNLLQREGYEDLEAVRGEGREQGIAESVLALLEDRGLEVSGEVRERILTCRDHAQLRRWLLRAATAEAAADAVTEP
jgi:Uma2 family endonuclease